jgi:hypothetical protein
MTFNPDALLRTGPERELVASLLHIIGHNPPDFASLHVTGTSALDGQVVFDSGQALGHIDADGNFTFQYNPPPALHFVARELDTYDPTLDYVLSVDVTGSLDVWFDDYALRLAGRYAGTTTNLDDSESTYSYGNSVLQLDGLFRDGDHDNPGVELIFRLAAEEDSTWPAEGPNNAFWVMYFDNQDLVLNGGANWSTMRFHADTNVVDINKLYVGEMTLGGTLDASGGIHSNAHMDYSGLSYVPAHPSLSIMSAAFGAGLFAAGEISTNSGFVALSSGGRGATFSAWDQYFDETTHTPVRFLAGAGGWRLEYAVTTDPDYSYYYGSGYSSIIDFADDGLHGWGTGYRLSIGAASGTGKLHQLVFNSDLIGFNVDPVAKPTVTGSRGGNAALQSLISALSNVGLVTDSTS